MARLVDTKGAQKSSVNFLLLLVAVILGAIAWVSYTEERDHDRFVRDCVAHHRQDPWTCEAEWALSR